MEGIKIGDKNLFWCWLVQKVAKTVKSATVELQRMLW